MIIDPRPSVLVMMSTYNGEEYLAEQIESIIAQKEVDLTLWISDDGSSDSTIEIVDSFSKAHPNILYRNNPENLGSSLSFMKMIFDADSELNKSFDYYAFSDQDDYWLPSKLIEATKSIKACSKNNEIPALYYSDITNVNARLEEGTKEAEPFASLSQNLETLLVCNWAAGCTMVFNRNLFNLAATHKTTAFPRIHDTWMHLIALTCGMTVPDLHRSFILRRISGKNQVGERGFGKITPKRFTKSIQTALQKPRHDFVRSAEQLLKLFSDEMHNDSKEIIESFLSGQHSLPKRIALACGRNYKLPNTLDTVTMKIRIILNRC